jgi:hypothetical protein
MIRKIPFAIAFLLTFTLTSCSVSKVRSDNDTSTEFTTSATDKTSTSPEPEIKVQFSTQFDDGWTSTMKSKWVEVSRSNGVVVRLHPGIEVPEDMRVVGIEQEKLGYYLSQVVGDRYTPQNFEIFPSQNSGSWYYGQGNVTESATGRQYFLGFMVDFREGMGYSIEVTAPDEDTYIKTFNGFEAIQKMQNYNQFQLTLAALAGTWEEETGSVQTSNVIRNGHRFVFDRNGHYQSQHNLVSGSVESLGAKVLDYEGEVSLNGWSMALTNRFEGKTEVYNAFFELTANGSVLRMIGTDRTGGLEFVLSRHN